MGQVPLPTPIFHITHVDNLTKILATRELRACAILRQQRTEYTDIAYQHIQDRRATKVVPCGPGGTLHDYVPFYFAPRSPMLYVNWCGGVPGYIGGQEPIVHLVSTAQTVKDAGLAYVFTDGHAPMAVSNYYTDLVDLDKIDWSIMPAKYWNDSAKYPDRKRRRQAEFLVLRRVPFRAISLIGVCTPTIQDRVRKILENTGFNPMVEVKRHWYY